MENCDLREETQVLKRQVIELQQALEAFQLDRDSDELSSQAAPKRNQVDVLRSALRKHATLYDPFPPKDRDFYQQSCPENAAILTDYNIRYENDESESLANLAEFHATFPRDHILKLTDGDIVLVRQVCIPSLLFYFIASLPSLLFTDRQ